MNYDNCLKIQGIQEKFPKNQEIIFKNFENKFEFFWNFILILSLHF